MSTLDDFRAHLAAGGRFTVRHDEDGRVIAVEPVSALPVHDGAGRLLGYSVGFALADVTADFRAEPMAERHRQAHACAMLAELDCYAALGDAPAHRLARWHAQHPDGPQTPEEYAEEDAVRAGFMKRDH